MVDPSVRKVTAGELRALFGREDYCGRVVRGELLQVVLKDRHPSLPRANEPYCTRSQLVGFVDPAGVRVALVHRYLRVDGSLGASGLPDPKRLILEGIHYYVGVP